MFHFLKGRYMKLILYHKLILCCSLKVEALQAFTLIAHYFDVVLRMAFWKLHSVEIFSNNHIPPKSLQWIWKLHYCDIWISSNVLSSINLNVSGTHPTDALITTIKIYNNYTKQSKTHLPAHDGLQWKSGTIKTNNKQIISLRVWFVVSPKFCLWH